MLKIDALLGFEKQNATIADFIRSKATRHRTIDGSIGVVSGVIPIPLVALAITAVIIVAQIPLIYRPLSKQIATIFASENGSKIGSFKEAFGDEMQEQNQFQYNLFNYTFLLEIMKEVISEMGIGCLVAAIPFVGVVFSVAMDAMIGATMHMARWFNDNTIPL